LIASNVPETDEAPWTEGTTYSKGARVMHAHGIWKSVADDNIGRDPSADLGSTWWVYLGATNRWRAFDDRLGARAVGGASITYSIMLPRSLNSIGSSGLVATSVRIVVTIPGPATIYDQTYQLSERPLVSNFWDYIHAPFEFRSDLILTGLTLPSGAVI